MASRLRMGTASKRSDLFVYPTDSYRNKTRVLGYTPLVYSSNPSHLGNHTMPIGLLVIAGIPTTIGVCEALSAQKKADKAAKEKAKFNLVVSICLDGQDAVDCFCIVKDGKVSNRGSSQISPESSAGATRRPQDGRRRHDELRADNL